MKKASSSQKQATRDQKYYQNFDFYFKRTSFRTMTLYYKTQYKPFYDKWKASKEPVSVLASLRDFVNAEFDGLLKRMSN